MQKVISVALVDDHTIVRQGIRAFLDLEPEIQVVAEAGTGRYAILIAAEYQPDVMLIDLMLPDMNGVEATRQVKLVSPRTQVVILTSYLEDELVLPALRAGALSYVIKDVNVEEVINVVRRAANEVAVIEPCVAQEICDQGTDDLAQLSEQEYEVLLKLASGYSNANIAQKLIISECMVENSVSSMLKKLNVMDRTQLAVLAWERGLMARHLGVTLTLREGREF